MIEIKGRKLMMAALPLVWLALILQLFILVDNSPGNGLTPGEVGRFFIFLQHLLTCSLLFV
jgi:hypothetical protein